MLTKDEVFGADDSAFKAQTAQFNVDPSREYNLQMEFKPKAQRSYAAMLSIYSNDPDTPVKGIPLSGRGTR